MEQSSPARVLRWLDVLRKEPVATYLFPALTFCLAFLIRLYWVRHAIIPPYGDVPSIERFAHNVASGLYYGTHGVYWPPAFIFIAGFTERWFGTGTELLAVRTVNAAISAMGVAALTDLGRRLLHSPLIGLLAGILMAIYIPSVYYSDLVLDVTMTVTMFIVASDAVVAYMDRPTWGRLVAAGVLLGIAVLSKPIALGLVLPAFVAWGLRNPKGFDLGFALRATIGLVLVVLAVNVPWSIRNLRLTGTPVFVDMNGGVNFYLAHNPKSDGYFVSMGNNDPVLEGGYDLPSTGKRAMHAGVQYFLAHPGADLREARIVTHLFWTSPDWDIPVYGKELYAIFARFHIPALQFLTIRTAALAGLLCLLPFGRRLIYLWLTIFGYNAGLALFFFAPRFRLPIEPFLLLALAGGIVQVARWILADIAAKRNLPTG